MFFKEYFWAKQRRKQFFFLTLLSWLAKKHFSPNKIKKSWQAGPFGSGLPWQWYSRVLCLARQWRENINYRFVIVNTVCNNTQGDGEEKNCEMPVSNECACPVLANYVLTKHFKGSTLNRSGPGCPVDAVQHSTDRCHFIMLSNFLWSLVEHKQLLSEA